MCLLLLRISVLFNVVLIAFYLVGRPGKTPEVVSSVTSSNDEPPHLNLTRHVPSQSAPRKDIELKPHASFVEMPWQVASQIISIDAFKADGDLSQEIIRLLALTENEVKELHGALGKVRQGIKDHEVQSAQFNDDEEGKRWARLEPNRPSVNAAKEAALVSITAILGSARANILKDFLNNDAFFEPWDSGAISIWLSDPSLEGDSQGIVRIIREGKVISESLYTNGSVPYERFGHLFGYTRGNK